MHQIIVVQICILAVPSLTASIMLLALRRARWLSIGVLGSALALVLFLPIRIAIHTQASFDDLGSGFEIFMEWIAFSFAVGLVHLILFAELILMLWDAVFPDYTAPTGKESDRDVKPPPMDVSQLPRYHDRAQPRYPN